MSGKCLAILRELKDKETPLSTNGAIYHLCKHSRTNVTKNNKKRYYVFQRGTHLALSSISRNDS